MTVRIHGLLAGLALMFGLTLLTPQPAQAQAPDAGRVQQNREACNDGRGDLEACVSYGTSLLNGNTVAEDPVAAARVWRAACDRGNLTACSHLGWVLRKSEGVTRDYPEALRLYLRACEGRVGLACFAAGEMLRDGEGIAADRARAKGRFNYACLYSYGPGCREEGSMYYETGGLNDAMNGYRSACQLGDRVGCGLVGWMAARGEGVPAPDFELAVRQYKQACAMGEETSCANLETYRSNGEGGTGYAALMAFEARERIIPSTLPPEQRMVFASAAFADGNYELAIPVLTVLSEEGMADADFLLGQAYWHGQGVGIDPRRAAHHFERASTARHPQAQWVYAILSWAGEYTRWNPDWAVALMRGLAENGVTEADPIWRAWKADRDAYFNAREQMIRDMARESEASRRAADAANIARIGALYSGGQNRQQNGQVCGMVYRNNQANQECMSRETYDRYYNPANR